MPANSFTQFQYLPPYGVGQPGSIPQGGGGGYGPRPFFRDMMDARRSAVFTPDATYPDGYLGTIRSRRDDRLLNALKGRQNQRAYQRGVHKGERIDKASYYWPPEFGPEDGLKAEAAGMRQAPRTQYTPVWSPRQFAVSGAEPGIGVRSQVMKRLAPSWQ